MPTVIFTTYHTRQGIKHKMCVCGIVLFIDDIMKKKLRLFIATISSYNILLCIHFFCCLLNIDYIINIVVRDLIFIRLYISQHY